MANTANSITSPQAAFLGHCDLTGASACTTRAPTATASLAGANIVIALAANATADQRISKIVVKGASSSISAATAGNLVGIWVWDTTKAYLLDEIPVSAVTPSTTVASFYGEKTFDDLVLPATHALYMSVTVATTSSTTALVASIHGANF